MLNYSKDALHGSYAKNNFGVSTHCDEVQTVLCPFPPITMRKIEPDSRHRNDKQTECYLINQ